MGRGSVGEEDVGECRQPEDQGEKEREQDGGAAHVLGPLGIDVVIRGDQIDHRFDGRVEQLDDQHHGVDGQQQAFEHQGEGEEIEQRQEQDIEQRLLAEGRLMPEGGANAVGGVGEGGEDAGDSGFVGFHVSFFTI